MEKFLVVRHVTLPKITRWGPPISVAGRPECPSLLSSAFVLYFIQYRWTSALVQCPQEQGWPFPAPPDWVTLSSPGWPGAHHVDQLSLKCMESGGVGHHAWPCYTFKASLWFDLFRWWFVNVGKSGTSRSVDLSGSLLRLNSRWGSFCEMPFICLFGNLCWA